MNIASEILEKCAAACRKCADGCNICADHCKDQAGMKTCFNLCNHCAEVATQCAIACESNSENKTQSLVACIKACEDCATECERHDDADCKKCAETCRKCAEECKRALGKKKPIWPWLMAGLALALVLIFFLVYRDAGKNTEIIIEKNDNTTTDASDYLDIKENNSIVAAYVNFIESNNEKMTLDHAYTSEALIKLTDATQAMANEVGYAIQVDLDKVKENAKRITKEPFETTHADQIRAATDIITNELQNIQKAKYPSLAADVEELKSASISIKPGTQTLTQKDAVKNYFSKASDLLKKMN